MKLALRLLAALVSSSVHARALSKPNALWQYRPMLSWKKLLANIAQDPIVFVLQFSVVVFLVSMVFAVGSSATSQRAAPAAFERSAIAY
jgi:hypothetical protein